MNIKKLITTFILRKEDHEEKEVIQQWKQESMENLESLRQMMKINELSDGVKNYQQVDTASAWNKVEHRLGRRTPVYHLVTFRNIAAVALLLVISLVAYQYVLAPSIPDAGLNTYVSSDKQDIHLSDGSLIKLDKNSTLKENAFRSVYLEGRAYFDITRDKSHPFSIQLQHGKITVLGTAFNINTSAKFSQIYVTEGKVKFEYKGKEYILIAGDLLDVVDDNVVRSAKPVISPEKWTLQKIVFENKSLHEVLETLSIIHNMEIMYVSQEKTDLCKINTSFTNESIEQILRELEILSGLKYTISNNKIVIKTYKC